MISNEEKILESLKEIYADGMQEITKLSLNSDDRKNFIVSNYKLFNFDLVENCHPERSKEKSPDALFAIKSKLYFIEFKEGICKRPDLRMKIHEGIHALYQFSQANKILTREEFLSLNINYVVIKRHAQDNEKGSEYLSTLENSLNLFSLKNLEGLILRRAHVIFKPETILDRLSKMTGGSIKEISYVKKCGSIIKLP